MSKRGRRRRQGGGEKRQGENLSSAGSFLKMHMTEMGQTWKSGAQNSIQDSMGGKGHSLGIHHSSQGVHQPKAGMEVQLELLTQAP